MEVRLLTQTPEGLDRPGPTDDRATSGHGSLPSSASRGAAPGIPTRYRNGFAFTLGVFAAMRILLSVVAIIAVGRYHPPVVGQALPPTLSPGMHNVVTGTDRWDALRFASIASNGYRTGDDDAAFFPGYPITVHAISMVTDLDAPDAALLVSNLAFLGALFALYVLTAREYTDLLARRTVVLVACFPTSFFFMAPYSESSFLLMTILAFMSMRRGRAWLAGSAAFLAASIRSVGVLLVPSLLIEAWGRGEQRRARAIVSAALPLMAVVLFGAYWQARSGDFLAPFHAQGAWHRTFEFPVITLGHALALGLTGLGSELGIYWTIDLLLTAVVLVALAVRWRMIPLSYLAYVAATLLVVLSFPLPERPLLSAPRFVLVLFPAFWAMADILRGRWFFLAVAASVAGFVAVSAAFMNWGYMF